MKDASFLIKNQQAREMGLLLNICTYNEISPDPELLIQILPYLEYPDDFVLACKWQNESMILPVLQIADSLNSGFEKRIVLGKILSELAVKFDSYKKEVTSFFKQMHVKAVSAMETLYIQHCISHLKDSGKSAILIIERDIKKELPQQKLDTVTGGSYTVRRAIPKTGRNEPCHCGSGKKYKKCCIEKDKELLQDSSRHEGLTLKQIHESPELTNDPGFYMGA